MSLNQLLQSLLTGIEGEERASFLGVVFGDPNIVGVVFRSLSPLGKTFVLRMLLLDRPVKGSLLAHWTVLPRPAVDQMAQHLTALGVFVSVVGAEVSYDLHASFRSTLVARINRQQTVENQALHVGEAPRYFFTASTAVAAPKVGDDSKWYLLLDRIISGGTSISGGSKDIDKIIARLGFGQSQTPPPTAFRFVLGTTGSQLWVLLADFLGLLEKQRGGGLAAAAVSLRVICGVMAIEKQSMQNKSSSQSLRLSSLIEDNVSAIRTMGLLEDLDVVRGSAASGGHYVLGPTADALVQGGELVADDDQLAAATSLLVGAQLLVDSNMHVTAYTKSSLQMKLVGLFCQVQRVMGRMLMGVLTRDSVQRAIEGGVTAETIIKFLSSNTHPVMEKGGGKSASSKLPVNVAMQIRLWEADCPSNRLRIEPVVVLTWRNDRTETTNRAVAHIKQIAESYQGLLFVKEEPSGGLHVGIKADVAHKYILRTPAAHS